MNPHSFWARYSGMSWFIRTASFATPLSPAGHLSPAGRTNTAITGLSPYSHTRQWIFPVRSFGSRWSGPTGGW